jgi:omega-amidase
MKLSIVQTDLAWEDKSLNFLNLDKLIFPLYNKTDIVILPEMFNTGFSMNPERLSELPKSESFNWMKNHAINGNFGICGSYMVIENRYYYNRWVFISPETESWCYDKRHLFTMSDENKIFTPGEKILIFSFRGVKICPFICYDLRFPVWSRNINNYDLIIYSANWPERRSEVWNTLLKARAIENQCYVAGSNRIGTDGKGIKYSGDSMIINPRGMIIASSDQDIECTVNGEISMTELSDFRQKFPVLTDADNFNINF